MPAFAGMTELWTFYEFVNIQLRKIGVLFTEMNHANTARQDLPRPLDGIRIVEYGLFHAGPGANAILGDLGAEVIKVETASGAFQCLQCGHLESGTQAW